MTDGRPTAGPVRAAEPTDHDQVVDVVHRAFEGYTAAIGTAPRPMTADYRAWIADGVVDVVDVDGRVGGVLVHWPEDDDQYVEVVAVDPALQGSGVGVRLLDHVAAVAGRDGRRQVRLHTNEAMTESLAWYLQHGYVEARRLVVAGFRRVELVRPIDP